MCLPFNGYLIFLMYIIRKDYGFLFGTYSHFTCSTSVFPLDKQGSKTNGYRDQRPVGTEVGR